MPSTRTASPELRSAMPVLCRSVHNAALAGRNAGMDCRCPITPCFALTLHNETMPLLCLRNAMPYKTLPLLELTSQCRCDTLLSRRSTVHNHALARHCLTTCDHAKARRNNTLPLLLSTMPLRLLTVPRHYSTMLLRCCTQLRFARTMQSAASQCCAVAKRRRAVPKLDGPCVAVA
jgi:hypothetical protein